MLVKCHSKGKFYTISCPEGTRFVLAADVLGDKVAEHDHLVVTLNGKMIRFPADPPELLPLLAESGNFGVLLVGDPEPDVSLDGASCPGCGEVDVAWLQLSDGTEAVHSAPRRFTATAAGPILKCLWLTFQTRSRSE